MKVCIEGTLTEFKELAELVTYGSDCKDTCVSTRTVPAGDDVPNRFREEGVQ